VTAAPAGTFATLADVADAARAALDPPIWDFLQGGADTEHTLRDNRAALDAIRFQPRVLVDVRQRSTTTPLFGRALRLPVVLAPIGSLGRFLPDGPAALALVAARMGTLACLSVNASQDPAEVTARVPDAPLVFQIYGYDDRDLLARLVARAEAAGCVAVCLTADSAVAGRRDRDLRTGVQRAGHAGDERAGFTWTDLARLRERTRLPLIVKGILSAADAARAVEAGVDCVYVSNHGGRQLDYAPATTEVLPEVVAAVAGRVPVLVDGGYQRGTDVLKGLALGATAVGIGRLQGWALAAAGEAGLEQALHLLQAEVSTGLALLGLTAPGQLTPACLRLPVVPGRPGRP
jgi:isopentenyl diphosphate isomerase/L-lactate dehydrogenase-like FMN-dependent dehydrogenase